MRTRIMKVTTLSLALLLMGGVASAQVGPADTPAPKETVGPSEKVNLVIVYGDDPCPKANGEDIVVCGRKPEKDRYRIPEPLRGDPNQPSKQAWGEQYRSLEYVGRSGTESCSPVGGGGFTGCFDRLAKMAKAEKRQADNASWTDLVAAERAKRLSTIDKDSDAIEARVKAEEAAEAAAKANPAPQQ